MSTMCGEDRIVFLKMRANSSRNGFLTYVGMAGTMDQSALVTPREFLFRLPDDLHGAIESEGSGQWGVGSWAETTGYG